MACFTVPLATAAVAGAAHRALVRKSPRNPFAEKFHWLARMMLGGSFLLAVEHVWHGEITWRFPFLTALKEGPEASAAMFREMATRGTAMTLLLVGVWLVMVWVSSLPQRKEPANA